MNKQCFRYYRDAESLRLLPYQSSPLTLSLFSFSIARDWSRSDSRISSCRVSVELSCHKSEGEPENFGEIEKTYSNPSP